MQARGFRSRFIIVMLVTLSQASIALAQSAGPDLPWQQDLGGNTQIADPFAPLREAMSQSSAAAERLAQIYRSANAQAATGHLLGAATQLYSGLQTIENQVPWAPPPHTLVAIEKGKEILVAVNGMVDREIVGWPNPADQNRFGGSIKYLVFSSIYQSILNAFHRLDRVYFPNAYVAFFCASNRECSLPPYGELPREYYDGIRCLARGFLLLEHQLGPLQAFDTVELVATQKTLGAAAAILDQSVYRRDFAALISSLHSSAAHVGALIQAPGVHGDEKRQVARAAVARAVAALQGSRSCATPAPSSVRSGDRQNAEVRRGSRGIPDHMHWENVRGRAVVRPRQE